MGRQRARDLGRAVRQLVPQGVAVGYGRERVERERDGGETRRGQEGQRERERWG